MCPEPFVVAFVETMYTVIESEGQVEVCVNLTRPMIDILEETVLVEAFNDANSLYIPPNTVLASELSLHVISSILITFIVSSS